MAEKFSLKDHLFNPETLGQLATEFASGVPGFKANTFLKTAVPGLQGRELLDRLEWIADCIERQLADDFPTMADQLQAAMPAGLDPSLRDDDFGHFIHAVPGILTVRHGMNHVERALDLLYAATQRFSMEFYIRPFLNAHPDITLARLHDWARDENYHVRRLVSEGTRPRLPWAKKIDIDPMLPLQYLDILHADEARFVTRSVANHLNDISKFAPDAVIDRLENWQSAARQSAKELTWMRRHALRTLIKAGHPRALTHLGYRSDADVSADLKIITPSVKIGDALEFEVTLHSPTQEPVILDYALHLKKSDGILSPKVFKMKDIIVQPGKPVTLKKKHKLKAGASTFTLYPGVQSIAIQVNGNVLKQADFELI